MMSDDQQRHCAAKFYILNFKVTDLATSVPDSQTEVPNPKMEVPDLESGRIRLNLAPVGWG